VQFLKWYNAFLQSNIIHTIHIGETIIAIIYWLIPLTLIILLCAVAVFFWAVKDGQFEDLDSEASKILFDDQK
jgi:cbb3-type cytochrome oxidase maturation protein